MSAHAPSSSAMLRDIARAPEALAALAARLTEFARFSAAHLTPEEGGRLYAFGCGDGLFAAEAMAGNFVAETALEILTYRAPALTKRDRVLAISMSGNVDRTVAAAEAVRDSGAGLAILTNGDGGRLGAIGAPRLSLDIASIKPFLCGTTSYLGTLFALAALAGRGVEAGRLAPALKALLETSLAALAELEKSFAGVRFLSAGPNIGSAAYGAAKIVELCRTPAWSADIEEFAHSQFWAADPGELIVYIAANPAIAALADHGAAALKDMGFATIAIETEGCPVPSASIRLRAPSVEEPLSPLAAAIPLQALAWRIATSAGFDPDTRAHLKNDEMRFTTSRRLTRASLIGTGH